MYRESSSDVVSCTSLELSRYMIAALAPALISDEPSNLGKSHLWRGKRPMDLARFDPTQPPLPVAQMLLQATPDFCAKKSLTQFVPSRGMRVYDCAVGPIPKLLH